MKRTTSFCFLLTLSYSIFAQSALNIELLGQFNRGNSRYSGSWSYTAPDGAEYALLGTSEGLAIYAIDAADAIWEVGFVPGPTSNWREVTTLGQQAYVTTEGDGIGQGMQVIDLSFLPDSVQLLTTYNETFTRGHIIQRDIYSEAPYVYISGTTSTQGVHILDVSDPLRPKEVGLYDPPYYIHDCHVNGNLLFAAAFSEGKMDIVNIEDKSNPVLVSDFKDFNGNTHSSWLSEDQKFLFVASELDGTLGRIYNIEDLEEVFLVATYTADTASLVHNPYIRGDFAFISHNTEGLRVVDIADPRIPVEVGYYDTFAGPSGGFSGLWSACPYFPSGKIIGGNREDGLYIWTFNNTKAGRMYGQVKDARTGVPIPSAQIIISPGNDTLRSRLDGSFTYGQLPGNYNLHTSASKYFDNTQAIDLQAADQVDLIIELGALADTLRINADFPLEVQPNPCRADCQFLLPIGTPAENLRIYNSAGALQTSMFKGNLEELTWDASQWAAGLYYFQLLDEKGKAYASGKFVVGP